LGLICQWRFLSTGGGPSTNRRLMLLSNHRVPIIRSPFKGRPSATNSTRVATRNGRNLKGRLTLWVTGSRRAVWFFDGLALQYGHWRAYPEVYFQMHHSRFIPCFHRRALEDHWTSWARLAELTNGGAVFSFCGASSPFWNV